MGVRGAQCYRSIELEVPRVESRGQGWKRKGSLGWEGWRWGQESVELFGTPRWGVPGGGRMEQVLMVSWQPLCWCEDAVGSWATVTLQKAGMR